VWWLSGFGNCESGFSSQKKKKKFFSFSSLIKTLESMPVPLLPLPPLPPPPLGDEEGEELEEKEREGGEELLEIGGIENAYTNEYDTRTSPSSCDWSEENILAVGCDAGPFVLLIVRFVVLNSFLLRNQYHNSADLVHSFLFLYDDRIPHKSTRRIPVQRRRV